ncbi:hypothetical protein B0H14DRAFT_3160175 [Mycena olivaceomarginata]|nr:hypothetical protein B0H14DRAFT_3160175 [Mycena olivaceomarginata]
MEKFFGRVATLDATSYSDSEADAARIRDRVLHRDDVYAVYLPKEPGILSPHVKYFVFNEERSMDVPIPSPQISTSQALFWNYNRTVTLSCAFPSSSLKCRYLALGEDPAGSYDDGPHPLLFDGHLCGAKSQHSKRRPWPRTSLSRRNLQCLCHRGFQTDTQKAHPTPSLPEVLDHSLRVEYMGGHEQRIWAVRLMNSPPPDGRRGAVSPSLGISLADFRKRR